MIDLSPRHLAAVRRLLAEHLPNAVVWAFGSRVAATAAEGSDLDLVVRSLDGRESSLTGLREAFRESDLPFSIELLDWVTIPEHFRTEIMRSSCVLQDGAPGRSGKDAQEKTSAKSESCDVKIQRNRRNPEAEEGFSFRMAQDLKHKSSTGSLSDLEGAQRTGER